MMSQSSKFFLCKQEDMIPSTRIHIPLPSKAVCACSPNAVETEI